MSDDVAALHARIAELEQANTFLEMENKAQANALSHKLALEWFPHLDKQIGCYDYRIATREITRAFDVFRARLLDPLLEENRSLKQEISKAHAHSVTREQ